MKQRIICKGLVVAVIILLSLSVTPSIGMSNNDDTTPPVTTHTLDPPEPDGNNGWYVSNVNVTLTATDDLSGVNVTYYRVDNGEWEIYTESFILSEDGDDILIEYYSVDYVENVEDVKSFTIDIDQTEPEVSITYEAVGGSELTGWDIENIATAIDHCSGMERVEFYWENVLQETVTGPGPEYFWEFHYPFSCSVLGLIRNRNISKDNVSFYIVLVAITMHYRGIYYSAYAYDNAGNIGVDEVMSSIPNTHRIYHFQDVTYPNAYLGYIGRNFIFTIFSLSDIIW